MAPKTDKRLTRDLMFDAVPNSSANILLTREIWSFGGMINEIMLVPLLQREKANKFILDATYIIKEKIYKLLKEKYILLQKKYIYFIIIKKYIFYY